MNSHSAWRASVEAELGGRSIESALTKKTHDQLVIEPLYEPRPTSQAIPPRASAPRTGSVLEAGVAAPRGPSLAWWRGAPGALSESTRVVIVEGAAAPAGIEALVIGAEGQASPAALDAAEKGAGAIAELAAAFVALARALDEGKPPSSLAVALSLGTDFFVEVAKLRAARLGIAGILAAAGASERALPLVSRQTQRSLASMDVETNALRSTLAGAAGLIGGATHIALLPHVLASVDAASGELASRLAWTQGEVLTRESHLDLFDDAARGAPLLEALTEQIGEGAWKLAASVLGGDASALDARIDADARARRRAIATRKRPLVGVSRFVGHFEGAAPGPDRDASAFEALRARGAGTLAAVVAIGDRKLEPRVDFAREVLELAGYEVRAAGRADDLTSALSSIDSAATVAILAMADAAFATDGVTLAAALTERGITVLMAGKPGGAEAALRDAGVRAFVYQGADLIEVLSSLAAGAA